MTTLKWEIPSINCGFCFSLTVSSFTQVPSCTLSVRLTGSAGEAGNSSKGEAGPFVKQWFPRRGRPSLFHLAICQDMWLKANFHVPNDRSRLIAFQLFKLFIRFILCSATSHLTKTSFWIVSFSYSNTSSGHPLTTQWILSPWQGVQYLTLFGTNPAVFSRTVLENTFSYCSVSGLFSFL